MLVKLINPRDVAFDYNAFGTVYHIPATGEIVIPIKAAQWIASQIDYLIIGSGVDGEIETKEVGAPKEALVDISEFEELVENDGDDGSLADVYGVGPKAYEKLTDAGINNVDELRALSKGELSEIVGKATAGTIFNGLDIK